MKNIVLTGALLVSIPLWLRCSGMPEEMRPQEGELVTQVSRNLTFDEAAHCCVEWAKKRNSEAGSRIFRKSLSIELQLYGDLVRICLNCGSQGCTVFTNRPVGVESVEGVGRLLLDRLAGLTNLSISTKSRRRFSGDR